MNKGEETIKFFNSFFYMEVYVGDTFFPSRLIDVANNYNYSDLPYYYCLNEQNRIFPTHISHHISKSKQGKRLILEGILGSLNIRQEYIINDKEPVLEEIISITNRTEEEISIDNLGFGFAKKIQDSPRTWDKEVVESKFTAVPFRRDVRGSNGEYEEFTIEDIATKNGNYRLCWIPGPFEKIPSPEYGAEGWVWTHNNGGMLVAKHNQDNVEFSLLRTHWNSEEDNTLCNDSRRLRCLLRFGGSGMWHREPEAARKLKPSESFTFGKTRYVLIDNKLESGYYAFRKFMNEEGHGIPRKYNPFVQWNELYDNPLWWARADDQDLRKKYYRLEDMELEAQKAKEIGCEALYLDPGWDTSPGSAIWASDRLGTLSDFVELMKSKYGLEVALHSVFAGWTKPTDDPVDQSMLRIDNEGKIINEICGGSKLFIETKANRMKELAKNGVRSFMLDGTGFSGACYSGKHGHDIPYTVRQHCEAIFQVIQSVKKEYPDVIIELHDPILAGDARYTQCHFKHALQYSFDENWAFEYMWEPLDDILAGRAVSLYYYNLAYEIPLYVHIDLRKDNLNGLAFWWYASTCRHLGVGGKAPAGEERWREHQEWLNNCVRRNLKTTTKDFSKQDPYPSPELWKVHKDAMVLYKRFKEYFVYGEFYGLDETVHIHLIKGKGAVIVVFNLSEEPKVRSITVKAGDIGMNDFAGLVLEGCEYIIDGNSLTLTIKLEKQAARVISTHYQTNLIST